MEVCPATKLWLQNKGTALLIQFLWLTGNFEKAPRYFGFVKGYRRLQPS